MVGGGTAAATAGYYLDKPYLMTTGAGVAMAGSANLICLYGADRYDATEEHQEQQNMAGSAPTQRPNGKKITVTETE
jgi:hypothetical protein